MRRTIHLIFATLLLAQLLPAQVKSFKEVTGHGFGERITQHHEMKAYLEYLAEASDRVTIIHQGFSWEERELVAAIVTSPANHARLDQIQANAQKLGDPSIFSASAAAQLYRSQPVVAWLGGSIHGFELSGSEGLLKLLEHLTTRDDADTKAILDNVVIIIDPMLNPDGRDAFAQSNHQNAGRVPNPVSQDWSNDFVSWEGTKFRTGHYYFDTNRDWFAHTQRETFARVATIQAWRPQIIIDAHEMGADNEFYFDPATEPYGKYFPEYAKKWFARFGQAYSDAFDEAGFQYTTRELFNYYYPGYTTSYGSYQGAAGMLYEQGSTRGFALERSDGSVRTLGDALTQQYTAAITAVKLASKERSNLLKDYYEAHVAAINSGKKGVRNYLITNDGDARITAELINLLMRSGVKVGRLSKATQVKGVSDRSGKAIGNKRFAAGSYVISTAQPRYSLIRTLMDPNLEMPADFLKKARARIDRGENGRFYDMTSWSLPLLFNLNGYSSTDGRALSTRPIAEPLAMNGNLPQENATYAYIFNGRDAATLAAMVHLRAQGYRVSIIFKPMKIANTRYPEGSVVVRVRENGESIHEAVREQAKKYNLTLTTANTGRSDGDGPPLGSAWYGVSMKLPKIALLAEDGIRPYSFGFAWYKLDRQYDIPITIRRTRNFGSAPMHDYNVIIIPEASADGLATTFGAKGMDRLKQWVNDGGTLVAIGSSVEFVRTKLKLIELRSWYDENKIDAKNGDDKIEPRHFTTPGAFMSTNVDSDYWLGTGYGKEFPVLSFSDRIYLAPEGPPSSRKRVVARYAKGKAVHIAGHAWSETLERLPESVFAYEERVGRGRVIIFAEDVNFRGYWRGADRMFLNAVLLGPSAP